LEGDPEPVVKLFSRRDDVTLANPLGPPRRGPTEVENAIRQAAGNFKVGSGHCHFEDVSRYATPDRGDVVHLERVGARLAGSETLSPISLRVTMIFRGEDDAWKVAHRHADPITTARPITSAIET
jgi:ketosteroid isomerase-like protein